MFISQFLTLLKIWQSWKKDHQDHLFALIGKPLLEGANFMLSAGTEEETLDVIKQETDLEDVRPRIHADQGKSSKTFRKELEGFLNTQSSHKPYTAQNFLEM